MPLQLPGWSGDNKKFRTTKEREIGTQRTAKMTTVKTSSGHFERWFHEDYPASKPNTGLRHAHTTLNNNKKVTTEPIYAIVMKTKGQSQ